MTLGEIITRYRSEHGMSMRAFARASGLSVTYISSLENGVTQRGNKPTPSLETYRAVAKAMCMDIDTLLRAIDDDIKIMPTSTGEHKLSPRKQELFDLIDSLPDDKVEAILRLLGEE
jgi:transcriptional regulator with XRE-family HTH domain